MGRILKKEKNMNDKYQQRVTARFAPDTTFEVKTIPFRAAETTELEELKNRLLLQLLNNTSAPEQNTLLRRAANDAAALAWATAYPLLFFPTLLDEKARAALLQWEHQERVRARSLNLVLETA
ncbi:hypothetical protein Cflav_PD5478 [Pedosphaera parvula Ellin514]|uniref:Uncharacterized protein n=2 Tax=Pedosphaera TaxID=1032526 RepID=B9XBF8_PEDPL|nr:hypothetical protein Cflav_PD5478 [Pedosphaera parvula Ellin514]